jgi:hypothetical protein
LYLIFAYHVKTHLWMIVMEFKIILKYDFYKIYYIFSLISFDDNQNIFLKKTAKKIKSFSSWVVHFKRFSPHKQIVKFQLIYGQW